MFIRHGYVEKHLEGKQHLLTKDVVERLWSLLESRKPGSLKEGLNLLEIPNSVRDDGGGCREMVRDAISLIKNKLRIDEKGLGIGSRVMYEGNVYQVYRITPSYHLAIKSPGLRSVTVNPVNIALIPK